MEENISTEKTYTRRGVLKLAGKTAVGVAVAGVVPSLLTACSKPAETPSKENAEIPSKEILEYEYMAASEDDAPFPYPYQKLDVESIKERAYASFFNKGGCCRAVVDAIAGQLAESTGYPWNQLPIDAFANGAGGYGAASLCGSLGGAATIIGFVCPPEDASKLTAELFKWYTTTDLPQYEPEVENEKVTATSVDCKDSVGIFIEKTGYAMSDPERKARCAGVAADTAGKAVELINNYYNL